MTAADTRERILDAAERAINRIGFGMVAFNAGVAEAEVSKGGVSHCFKTKNQCLINRRIEHHEAVLDADIPTGVVWKALLVCAGLWTTPPLARASREELPVFFKIMQNEMLQMVDQAAEKSPAAKSQTQ